MNIPKFIINLSDNEKGKEEKENDDDVNNNTCPV
jgi:hypothetical protein